MPTYHSTLHLPPPPAYATTEVPSSTSSTPPHRRTFTPRPDANAAQHRQRRLQRQRRDARHEDMAWWSVHGAALRAALEGLDDLRCELGAAARVQNAGGEMGGLLEGVRGLRYGGGDEGRRVVGEEVGEGAVEMIVLGSYLSVLRGGVEEELAVRVRGRLGLS